jgi:hypothetical protein
MEYSWHVIFGEQWDCTLPDPSRLWPGSRLATGKPPSASSPSGVPTVLLTLTDVDGDGGGGVTAETGPTPALASPPESPSAVAAATQPPLAPTAASRWAPATDVVRGTVVVVASFGEDESWLAEQPFPYVVMSKTLPAGAPNSVAINKAQEADAYIAFILQNYDDLPPRMIFCHNHNIAWHIDGVCVAAAGSTWLCM